MMTKNRLGERIAECMVACLNGHTKRCTSDLALLNQA